MVAGHLATPGASFPLSPSAWQEMHNFPTEGSTFGMKTNFTQGGVNKFEEEGGRDGYYGWFGYGGSVFQWHPDLRIGFGYTPTLLHWQDATNSIGRNFQQEVVKCVQNLQK